MESIYEQELLQNNIVFGLALGCSILVVILSTLMQPFLFGVENT